MAARALLGAAVAVIATASCVRIADVVQPGEIRPGKTFEALVIARADADSLGAAAGPAFGLLAVSLPGGWDVEEVRYRGPTAGKMRRREDIAVEGLPAPVGYRWTVFATAKQEELSDFAGARFEVKVKIKAGDEKRDYRLGYAAGTAAGDGDVLDVAWDGVGEDAVVARWVTVK